MGRNVTLDFSAGGGSDTEFLIGTITLEPTAVHEIGNRVVLPAPRSTGINAGVGVLEDVAISPAGPEPAWAYRATVRDSISGKAQSWLVGVPSGTTAIPFNQLTKFTTTIPPHTTAGMMQNWADTAQDGATRAEDAADRAEAPTDEMNKTLIENPASLTSNALSAAIDDSIAPVVAEVEGTYAPRRGNTLASIGDSITWRNKMKIYSGASTAASTGWIHWANAELGQRITELGNVSVSGKRTDEMVTEQLPAVLALNPAPGWCTVVGGANDIILLRTAAEIQTSLFQLYEGLAAKGIGIIAGTITPQTGLTTDQKNNIYRVNRWIKLQAETRKGFILVDWHAAMSDAAGDPLAGVLADNVHQSVKGAAIMGKVFAEAVRAHLPAVDVLPMPGDFANSHPNPFKSEAGLGYGPDGLQTADVAYNYRFATADATTLTGTAAIVPRTDGIPGNWQGMTIDSGNGRLTNASVVPALGGQKWQAVAELDIDAAVAAGGVTRVSLSLFQSGGSPIKNATYLDNDPDVASGEGASVPVKSGRMVLRTPPVVLGAGATGIFVHVRVYGSTGGGQVRVGRQSTMQVA